ncbi:MAG: ABC transporter permease [Chloroflexi bacterium]|nr:ABC transporter permease [Chloroflexota bacterium]MCI0577835.1 ABC transporter permease [Chloroflexota bacterium]MCI0646132.1 ABC transporter permease [Chloroflexota bacterium]MCI0731334.1 ABC transporter permease [Chloroflexota bacterium]
MIDITNILTLTHKELRDARRNRWFLLYAVAFAGLSLALSWLATSGLGNNGLAGFGRTGATLVNLVLLVVPLMGLTLGALSLAGEREQGTLLCLLAQPVGQLEVLLGKFLGLALALLAALALGFGLSGLLIAWQGGATQAAGYLLLVLLAFLLALASLSLGFLISAAAGKGSTAVGVALFAWLLLVFFGDLGLMGTALVLRLDVNQLFAAALLNPLQLFKMAAILDIRSSLEVLGPAGIYAVRTYGDRLMPLLLTMLLAWTILPLCFTYLVFHRRGVL